MKFSIKTNVLTVFLLIVAIITSSLLFAQYYFNTKLATDSTDKMFQSITQDVVDYKYEHYKRINNILQANNNNKNLNTIISYDYKHPALHDLTQILRINDGISSIYFTQENGNFYKLVNIKASPSLNALHAPKNAKWIVIISIKNEIQYTFLDTNLEKIKLITKTKEFNPTKRPWYLEAIKSDEPIHTLPYMFLHPNIMGITYAYELNKKGTVLAIDYTTIKLNQILSMQKFDKTSEVFLFDISGTKVASSDYKLKIDDNISNASKTIDKSLLDALKTNKDSKIIKYTEKDINYLSIYTQLSNYNLYLGVKLNSDILLAPYNESLQYLFILSIIILILSVPLILFSTNLIVQPIKELIQENEKIKNREFHKVKGINTHIIEFEELSTSLVNMSTSIDEYQDAQEELLESIVKLIAEAIDAKSPYTGGHCHRVPEIAQLLVKEASDSNIAQFKEFKLESEDELREFEIGAWLHDCGKVTTPEYVVDKSTKLETINDRIHEVRTRFEVLWRDAQINYLESRLNNENIDTALETLNKAQKKLLDDFEFIASVNIGGEYMSEDKQNRVKEIANQEWKRHFDDTLGLGEVELLRYDKQLKQELPVAEKLLSDKKQHIIQRENFDYENYERDGFKEEVPEHLYNYGEVYNLCIEKGTLSYEERYKINEHIIQTIKMLEKIPFPSHMKKVPEYAGTHHETLIGTGYPRKLNKNELSIPARIMAIADVFEALTASDRPYKKAKTLSESIKIMSFMVKDQHLDEDLFKLFLQTDIYKSYAKKYLKPEQIDEVDIEQYL